MNIEFEDSRRITNNTSYLSSVYNDPFKWGLVKGIALLCVGIKFARLLRGFELMPASP